jgi:hypothetical protein
VRAQERGSRGSFLRTVRTGSATQLPGKFGDIDGKRTTLAESVYTHTRYRTGTKLDGSAGFKTATSQLRTLLFGEYVEEDEQGEPE